MADRRRHFASRCGSTCFEPIDRGRAGPRARLPGLGTGFVPVRKPNKLPAETARVTYDLEYGTDALEIHRDAIRPGARVLIVDDLLATGGTAGACVRLVRELGGIVAGVAVVVELEFLGGRAKLGGIDVFALLKYSK